MRKGCLHLLSWFGTNYNNEEDLFNLQIISFSISDISENVVTISYEIESEDSYVIHYSLNGGSWTLSPNQNTQGTIVFDDLEELQQYNIQLRITNSQRSVFSGILTFTTQNIVTDPEITSHTFTGLHNSLRIEVDGDDGGGEITSLIIAVGSTNIDFSNQLPLPVDFVVPNITPNQYTVSATISNSAGSDSETQQVSVFGTVVPSITSVVSSTTTSVTLSYSIDKKFRDIEKTEYNINAGSFIDLQQTTETGQFTISDLTPGTSYNIRLRASNDLVNYGLSTIFTVSTQSEVEIYAPVITGVTNDDLKLNVAFTHQEGTNPVDRYEVSLNQGSFNAPQREVYEYYATILDIQSQEVIATSEEIIATSQEVISFEQEIEQTEIKTIN